MVWLVRRILFAIVLAVTLLAPTAANAGCKVMDVYECGWFDQGCDPCTASAIIYWCDYGIVIRVTGCCICT